jgi:hypothetical protein
MKWILGILTGALLVIISFWAVGSNMVSLPTPHDPFPATIRKQLDTLNNHRREIEWLADTARMAGRGSQMPQEKQDYDELAEEANAWLKTAGAGLELNKVDSPWLTEQFEDQLLPKARKLSATLKSKGIWLAAERRSGGGILRAGAADVDHFVTVLENGWDDVKTYFKSLRADDVQSRKIALNQLDGMKWLPWSQLMGEEF